MSSRIDDILKKLKYIEYRIESLEIINYIGARVFIKYKDVKRDYYLYVKHDVGADEFFELLRTAHRKYRMARDLPCTFNYETLLGFSENDSELRALGINVDGYFVDLGKYPKILMISNDIILIFSDEQIIYLIPNATSLHEFDYIIPIMILKIDNHHRVICLINHRDIITRHLRKIMRRSKRAGVSDNCFEHICSDKIYKDDVGDYIIDLDK